MNELVNWLGANVIALLGLIAAVASAVAATQAVRVAQLNARLVREQVATAVAARRFEALLRAHDQIRAPEVSLARRRVLGGPLPPVDEIYAPSVGNRFRVRDESVPIHEQMRKVWASYNHVGMLVDLHLLEPRDAYAISTMAVECWQALQPYIEFERKHDRPKHLDAFERLAYGTRTHHFARHHGDWRAPMGASAMPTPNRHDPNSVR